MHQAARWVVAVLLCAAPVGAQVGGDVIYGDDDRLDLYQVKSPVLLRLADSTVGLFPASRVKDADANGVSQLVTESYSEDYSLCPEEPFFNQRTGAFCSGSLVGPDLLMTAGHCVRSESACQGTKFVFGFAIKEEGKLPESVPTSDVYGCAALLGREEVSSGADWALIRLDRPVTNHKPLAINRSGVIEKGTPILVIGHPAGLPTKVSGGATVRDPSPNGYFVANLDTYGGNSGSAVLNAKNGQVEGILVRGEQDYEWRGSCRVSKVCSDDGCRGEDVTKISALSASIPPAAAALAKAPVLRTTFVKPGPALAKLIEMQREFPEGPRPPEEIPQAP